MNNQAVFLAATKIKTNRKLKELADKHTQIEERKREREKYDKETDTQMNNQATCEKGTDKQKSDRQLADKHRQIEERERERESNSKCYTLSEENCQ